MGWPWHLVINMLSCCELNSHLIGLCLLGLLDHCPLPSSAPPHSWTVRDQYGAKDTAISLPSSSAQRTFKGSVMPLKHLGVGYVLRRKSLSEKAELLLQGSEKITAAFRHIKPSFEVRSQTWTSCGPTGQVCANSRHQSAEVWGRAPTTAAQLWGRAQPCMWVPACFPIRLVSEEGELLLGPPVIFPRWPNGDALAVLHSAAVL